MLKTNKYIFNNKDVRITVLSKLANSALRGCNRVIKAKSSEYQLMKLSDMESIEESLEELRIETFKLLLCEWKKD
jgi:hypothetical protein